MPVICLCYRQIMQPKSSFSLILFVLFLLGAAGLWQILNLEPEPTQSTNLDDELHSPALTPASSHSNQTPNQQASNTTNTTIKQISDIEQLIVDKEVASAIATINQRYSSLSSIELESLKRSLIFLALQQTKNEKKNTLLLTSGAFDDVEVWQLLGDAALSDDDWPLAYRAQLRASELQNDSIRLGIVLDKLSVISSHLRKTYQQNGDLIGIKNLYQDLADRHPSFARFNYELAVAMINIGELDAARPLLEALSYDLDLGRLAQQTLDQLNTAVANTQTRSDTTASLQIRPQRDDLVVPLIRVGNSFMVNSSIEQRSTRLLLDTGASITSLSSNLVSRLGLADTGRSINLSTANGITQAKLYRVNRLQIGSVVLRNMIVAEIDLSSQSGFQGLLGTDVLNQLSPKYSYLIDNQRNALIFTPSS